MNGHDFYLNNVSPSQSLASNGLGRGLVFTEGDRLLIQVDMDARTLQFLRNGKQIPGIPTAHDLPEHLHVFVTGESIYNGKNHVPSVIRLRELAAGATAVKPSPADTYDAQLAAAIAASLDVSDPVTPPPTLPTPPPTPVTRVKRWGDGLEAPAAGSRNFVPQGFEVTLDVSDAITRFGHSASHVAQIMDAGRAKASTSPAPLASTHAAALYAYTEESPLYGTLNYTMRTPHTSTTPTDAELKRYGDYIVHTERALSSLPTHVSEIQGNVYRGIKVLLSPDIYAPGKRITWQAFSSSTKKQTATLDFVNVLPGRKLSGSLFVIDSITAKDIRHFSAIPSEEEVLFPPNSQFKVEKVVSNGSEKKALLNQLGAYDMTDLDVYVLKQIA